MGSVSMHEPRGRDWPTATDGKGGSWAWELDHDPRLAGACWDPECLFDCR